MGIRNGIITAEECKRLVVQSREKKAETLYKELISSHRYVVLKVEKSISASACRGSTEVFIEISRYLGTYWINVLKHYLQMLGYGVFYNGDADELLVRWR